MNNKRARNQEAQFDSIEANLNSIAYNLAAMKTDIRTAAYRRMCEQADRYDEQGRVLHEIAHRPRRRKIFGLF